MTESAEATFLEHATSLVLGGSQAVLPTVTRHPAEVLQDVLARALAKPPCVLAFSGGFDSSLLLSVAAHTARERGLDPPLVSTLRNHAYPESREDEWQDAVASALPIGDWNRHDVGEELDFIGPMAERVIGRIGVQSPSNAHALLPCMDDAAGGTLMTGIGGDGVFRGWRWSAGVWGAHTQSRSPRTWVRIGHARAPRPLKWAVAAARERLGFPWLHRSTALKLEAAWFRELIDQPMRWDAYLGRFAERRFLRVGLHATARCAEIAGCEMSHPFLDREFLGSLATNGGAVGFGDRPTALRTLFERFLPPRILVRTDKANLERFYWGSKSATFARAWNGPDFPAPVDSDVIRRMWREPGIPDVRTAGLLQMAWLAAR